MLKMAMRRRRVVFFIRGLFKGFKNLVVSG